MAAHVLDPISSQNSGTGFKIRKIFFVATEFGIKENMSSVTEKVARIQHEIRLITNQLTEVPNPQNYSTFIIFL